MQLAMFDNPPADPRCKSSSRRVGESTSTNKAKGPLTRLQGRPDRPRPKSAPGLPFLKPAPSSGEVDKPQEARGPEPVIEEAVVELDDAAPTRRKLMPPEVFTEGEIRALVAVCSTREVTGHRNRALLAVL